MRRAQSAGVAMQPSAALATIRLRNARDDSTAVEVHAAADLGSIARCIGDFARQRRIHPAEVEYWIHWPEPEREPRLQRRGRRPPAPPAPAVAPLAPVPSPVGLYAVDAVRLEKRHQSVTQLRLYRADAALAPCADAEVLTAAALAHRIAQGATAVVVLHDDIGAPMPGPMLKAARSGAGSRVVIADGDNHGGLRLSDLPRF